ncbi:carotenoid oxygenase [Sorangium cellulosum]|uniref:Carotenoid oxygenase n=1 Tax=Sorangium cellulosum TaxID=56 RepID=A0A4P2QA83_SORCE|nr:carotenoid oxygenase family protein [Sorangium cellulosum]AUX26540.1 carotenoid oxygenase [Sorangium cellulosum]
MIALSRLLSSLGLEQRKADKALRNPYLEGNYAPFRSETEAASLELVAGEVPAALSGTLYRIGPAPRFDPPDPVRHHWFEGDGMVDAFRFDGGRVAHRRRWVRTDKVRWEEQAGRALFDGMRSFGRRVPLEGWKALGFTPAELIELRVRSLLGLPPREEQVHRILRAHDRSNTNVLKLAGRLLTLVESAAAHEIDPDTLATRGRFTFGGAVETRPMVAHPKVDPESGAIYTFGYSSSRPYVTYYAFTADGSLRFSREIDVPFPAMMHDFGVTATRAVFYHLPATMRPESRRSDNPVRWEPSEGARLAVVSRDDPSAPVRHVDLPACYIFHTMNAFDDGGSVVLDVVRYPRLPLFDLGGENPNPPLAESPDGRLTRLRIEPDKGVVSSAVLDETPAEFPVVDPRFATRPYRYGWMVGRRGDSDGRGHHNAIALHDHLERRGRYHELGRSSFTSEPIFAPRGEASPEGDGWLLAVVYRAEEDRSDLLVLDALDIEREPVAVLRCPHRIPYGFHGSWVERG